jgi:protein-S-isoprenylcysteine O-methyltransferase Ste14
MAEVTTSAVEPDRLRSLLGTGKLVRAFLSGAVWLSTLFLGAGTLHWLCGWIFVLVYGGCIATVVLALRHWNPELMAARLKWRRKNTQAFDKIFFAIHIPLTGSIPAIAGLDVVRFHRSSMPFWIMAPATVLFLFSCGLILWTLMANPWAEQTVRIQADRDQRVVSSGPYRFVRHPMYVGALAMYPAMACMLGSMMALAVAGIVMLAFVWRTAREDRMLHRELPGYEAYARLTRYRLIPGIW